jgi:hypothetical protein
MAGADCAVRGNFQDVSEPSGVAEFHRFSWGFGGDGIAGAAWFDYNNDGLLDLYLTNGKDITTPGHDGFENALFENQGDGTFVDVAPERGVTGGAGNAGVIAADLDNDGDQDIFLTGDGGMLSLDPASGQQTIDSGVVLYQNQGPPGYDFLRVDNEAAGLVDLDATMSPAFGDLDNDGLLDLFITASGTPPAGCQPPPACDPDDPTRKVEPNRLFLNRTDGGPLQFVDVSVPSGIAASTGGALATVLSDYNRDGLLDIFVANGAVFVGEPTPLELFENQGYSPDLDSPVFVDVTQQAGLGTQSAWMGIASGDFDGNGTFELFVTNASLPPHALYRWDGELQGYVDVSELVGIGGPPPSPSDYFGWGATAQDFDNDGRQDLFFAGSFAAQGGVGRPDSNPGVLLYNGGLPMAFTDCSESTGVDLFNRHTSGVAAADFNNDGRVDILVATDSYEDDLGKPVLLLNRTPRVNRSVTLRLAGNGTTTNRDAVGARILAFAPQAPGQRRWHREIYAGSSFLSMDSKWPTIGLGPISPGAAVWVAVDWPDGIPLNSTVHGPFPSTGFIDISQPPAPNGSPAP